MSIEEALAANTAALNANTAALSGGSGTGQAAKPAKKTAAVSAPALEVPAGVTAAPAAASTSPDFKSAVDVFTKVAQAKGRDEAKKILTKYGATQLSTMSITHLPAFTADCTAALAPVGTPAPAGSDLI